MRATSMLAPLLLVAGIAAVGLVEHRLASRQPAEGSGLLLHGAQVETHGEANAKFRAKVVEAGSHGRVASGVSGQVATAIGKFNFSADTLRMLDDGLRFEGDVSLADEKILVTAETVKFDRNGILTGNSSRIRISGGELRSRSFSISRENGLTLEGAVRAQFQL